MTDHMVPLAPGSSGLEARIAPVSIRAVRRGADQPDMTDAAVAAAFDRAVRAVGAPQAPRVACVETRLRDGSVTDQSARRRVLYPP